MKPAQEKHTIYDGYGHRHTKRIQKKSNDLRSYKHLKMTWYQNKEI